MKFLAILSGLALFGSFVEGVPLDNPESSILPLSFGQVCVVCETIPAKIRDACYSHCQTASKAWAANNTIVVNTTMSASVMRSSIPLASNGTLTTYLDLTDFSADAVGICKFCDGYSGRLGRKCHKRCHQHSPTEISSALKAVTTVQPKPIGISAVWDFCYAGCQEHRCNGPYFGQCVSTCHLCFAHNIEPVWNLLPEWPEMNTHGAGDFEPNACFCPTVEFGDRWQDDQDRYEEAIDREFVHDDDYSSDDRTDWENDS